MLALNLDKVFAHDDTDASTACSSVPMTPSKTKRRVIGGATRGQETVAAAGDEALFTGRGSMDALLTGRSSVVDAQLTGRSSYADAQLTGRSSNSCHKKEKAFVDSLLADREAASLNRALGKLSLPSKNSDSFLLTDRSSLATDRSCGGAGTRRSSSASALGLYLGQEAVSPGRICRSSSDVSIRKTRKSKLCF